MTGDQEKSQGGSTVAIRQVALVLVALAAVQPWAPANTFVVHHPQDDGVDWISKLVTPYRNTTALDQISGRWYVVEVVFPMPMWGADTCVWLDFWQHENGSTLFHVEYYRSSANKSVRSADGVLDRGVWHQHGTGGGELAVLDLEHDVMSLAVCPRSYMCFGYVLSRDLLACDRRSEMLQVHRRMREAGLNHTRWGIPVDPEVCNTGNRVPDYVPQRPPVNDYEA
ncbi:uncharacterized protein LOC126144800 [Schistocerca cancellata]|uniref:uncharacterized protein LOC126144800 n=1 Tax=Schistocerca cancellata TaxID=274614 RepID=UPI002118A21D|nr:uncharacterized protein LOC126144800 [Schistocerca cancellata]